MYSWFQHALMGCLLTSATNMHNGSAQHSIRSLLMINISRLTCHSFLCPFSFSLSQQHYEPHEPHRQQKSNFNKTRPSGTHFSKQNNIRCRCIKLFRYKQALSYYRTTTQSLEPELEPELEVAFDQLAMEVALDRVVLEPASALDPLELASANRAAVVGACLTATRLPE